ncbi:hypothetical protein FRB95_002132, partial [Tulasnella sp. JGI-2019a]
MYLEETAREIEYFDVVGTPAGSCGDAARMKTRMRKWKMKKTRRRKRKRRTCRWLMMCSRPHMQRWEMSSFWMDIW